MVTLRFDERPWTVNWARAAKHWSVVARVTKKWRDAFYGIALEHADEIRSLGPVVVTVTPYLRDGRGKQDVGGCAGAAKAAIDGIADAVWGNDDPSIVTELRFRSPVRGQGDGLELVLTSAQPRLGGPALTLRAA